MAKASDKAKEQIFAVLAATYPESAIVDKKMYINFNIEGEPTQIAVSLTAPKTKIDFGSSDSVEVSIPKYTEETINEQMKEVEDIFDFFNL